MTREPLKPGDFIEIRQTDSGLTFVGVVTRATAKGVTARWERRERREGITKPAFLDPAKFRVLGRLVTGPQVARLAKLLADEEAAVSNRLESPAGNGCRAVYPTSRAREEAVPGGVS